MRFSNKLGFLPRHSPMDEEDHLTLSNLFKSRLRCASTHADHSVHSAAAESGHSKNGKALEKSQSGKGMKGYALQSLAIGDLVWAKTSPATWRPSKVKGFRGPLISISFFGSQKTRWFNSSDIFRFEETYPRMVRMVKAKLSYEIDLALDELARNTAVGLKCCCSVSAAEDDLSLAVKRGFNPQEISCFLLDKAVSPQVVEGEIATVVRVSAALNAFRYGVVVCNTSEVDEGFCAEGVLDFVLRIAVNRRVDDKTVAQLYAFRRFTSVKPAWFYQLDWEFEDDCLESRTIEVDLELPDCTAEDELYHGRNREPEVDVSIKPQEECDLLDVNFKQEVRERCVINMLDFSFFDTDMYESLIYNQHQMDMDGGQSAGKDTCRNTSEGRILHSCPKDASLMSEIDANITSTNDICASVHSELVSSSHNIQVGEEVTSYRSIVPKDTCRNTSEGRILHSCPKDASLMSEIDANITSTNDICASVHSELVSLSHNIQVGEEVTSYRSIVPNLEKTEGEGDTSMPVRSDKCNPVEIKSSAENLSLRTVHSELVSSSHNIQVGEEVTSYRSIVPNLEKTEGEGDTIMPVCSDKCNPVEIKSSAENLSLRTVPYYGGQLHSLPNNKCSVFSPMEDLNLAIKPQSRPEVPPKASTVARFIALIPEMAPFAETALLISGNTRKSSESLSSPPCSETIAPSGPLVRESKSAMKVQFSNQSHFSEQGHDVHAIRNLNYPRHASKPHSGHQQHNRHIESNSKPFYASPLVRNGLRSSSLLTMKFPMYYTLPTKEQLEKKFSVFGPLDHTRTKVFFYTGVGQVVFLRQADAVVAHKYLKRKKIFGQANVRFWLHKLKN